MCQEIEILISKFWWGAKEGEKKIHWMRWKRLERSKKVGRMGFRGFSEFNQNLLGNHFWRLMKEEGSLFERVFKSRYYPKCSIMESKTNYNPNYVWRSILSSKELIQRGTRWCIENGDKAMAKKDNWLMNVACFKVVGHVRNVELDVKVSYFIDNDLGM
ncbi:unnamed protein product [Vicia faba]|uniref:Uncharacterized protein n=1 Tax=Vicia faba TaxID=3906 RepID=A0AAV1A2F0_VICFA|nr:unnamed protein product [Vicia faba]